MGGGIFGCVRIGFGFVGIFDKGKERTIWDNKGQVVFKGKARIGHGSRFVVGEAGKLELGDNFQCTSTLSLICYKSVKMGQNVLISWETLIMDTDFHRVLDLGVNTINEETKEIIVGNDVWIGARATILKGSVIPSHSIIGAMSLISRVFKKEYTVIAGNPAVIIKHNVTYEIKRTDF